MNLLDNLEAIKKLDKSNVLQSIDFFPKQALQALQETEKLNIPDLHNKVKNIVVCGMGGSAFALEIVKSLFTQDLKVPLEIIRDYNLPKYVNHESLILAVSYSGSTAETLSALEQALKRKAYIFVLASGGKLAEIKEKHNLYGYIFSKEYNPCGQPRVGIGYTIFGGLGLLLKAGLISATFNDVSKKIRALGQYDLYSFKHKLSDNLAKQLALKLKNKFVIVAGSEFLEGCLHGFANQLNETAKTNSSYHFIPELNHHRMEGLRFPVSFRSQVVFIFYYSNLYDKRNQIRYPITQDVIKKNHYSFFTFTPKAKDKISQTLEIITFNSYLSFYLGILYGLDPNLIPWVDYFKKELAKQ